MPDLRFFFRRIFDLPSDSRFLFCWGDLLLPGMQSAFRARKQQCLDDLRQATDGMLEPSGVMVIVRRVRVEASHFRRDAVGPEDPQAISGIMHPELEGKATLGASLERAWDALAGSSGHFLGHDKRRLFLCAEMGVGLPIVKAEAAPSSITKKVNPWLPFGDEMDRS